MIAGISKFLVTTSYSGTPLIISTFLPILINIDRCVYVTVASCSIVLFFLAFQIYIK